MLFTLLLTCSITTSAASSVTDEFKVTEVFLKADDGRPTGPCPVRVVFRGYITANGPGAIKYTFTRSDGATGPVYIMEFKQAGTQPVMTDWTLGDPRVLPRYAGWQAVKAMSPVEIESSHETGSFEINCGGTDVSQTRDLNPKGIGDLVRPKAPESGYNKVAFDNNAVDARRLTVAYDAALPAIADAQLLLFRTKLEKLKSLNDELASKLDRAPKSANINKQQLQDEFKTILKEKDRTKLDQRIAEFRDRYEPQFMEQVNAAGIDIGAERQRAASLIGLEQQQVTPEAYLNAHRMLAVGTVSEFVDDRPPVEAAPEFYEDVLPPPFIEATTRGSGAANGRDGTLRSSAVSPVSVGSTHQSVSSLTQGLTTRLGARRLHVSVPINDLDVYMRVGAFVGDASAEFAITLRVFDGAREVAKRRVPIQRLAAAYIGFDSFNRRFPPITLGCEFERSSTSVVGTYLMVVEFETLAGSQGFGDATSSASGRVGPFTVRTY